MMENLNELIARWDSNEVRPHKGRLIDWDAYMAEPKGLGCMCAQGQVLHTIGGWEPEKLRDTVQLVADAETAKLLNISRAHAVLLRIINDSVAGAPSIVFTDPGKVLGDEWSKLLDFWWYMDTLDKDGWRKVAAARAAAWAAARAAARAAAGDAAGAAAWEIQGAHTFRTDARPFFFLSMFGFASPDEIPARPVNYGKEQA